MSKLIINKGTVCGLLAALASVASALNGLGLGIPVVNDLVIPVLGAICGVVTTKDSIDLRK